MAVRHAARLSISHIGPFEHADLELRSLTILIGRNSTGKSLLLNLIWLASTTTTNSS